MKRLMMISMIMLLVCSMCMSAFADVNGGDIVKVTETKGYSNVPFGDSYYGFCIDADKSSAEAGDAFKVADSTSKAVNVNDGEDISNYLKTLFVAYFDYFFTTDPGYAYFGSPFETDNNNNFVVKESKKGLLQDVIWRLTNDKEYEGNTKDQVDEIVDKIKALTEQEIIHDQGYSRAYTAKDFFGKEYTVNVVFDFRVMITQKNVGEGEKGQQNYFAYKIYNNPNPNAPTPSPIPRPTEKPTATPIPINPDDPGQGGDVPPQELPETGDSVDLVMWIGMLAVSVAGIVFLASRKGKMFH